MHVRASQRRTLAAREAGIATVPVYGVDASDDDTARRIVEQLIENDQREPLTDDDRIQAWRALAWKACPRPRPRSPSAPAPNAIASRPASPSPRASPPPSEIVNLI